ncbi:hypothetical protein EEK90_06825 [Muribaculaceae bacterium Isolate-036 (Harlan)]|nr:hypothetical protein EEK90_06825 [Muribaculaceae bacterium Isolate-036 (Harlan)]
MRMSGPVNDFQSGKKNYSKLGAMTVPLGKKLHLKTELVGSVEQFTPPKAPIMKSKANEANRKSI